MNRLLGFAFICAAIVSTAAATSARADAADPGVARLAYLDGDVGVQRGDSSETTAAEINAPLLPGDALMTANGRAEISLARGARLRLAPNTQVRAVRLDADREIQVAGGTIELRLMRPAAVQIDTPDAAMIVSRPGAYLISVADDGSALVAVREGALSIQTPSGDHDLGSGDTVTVAGSAQSPDISAVQPPASDDFDSFNAQRDAELQRLLGHADAPYDVDGVEMLGSYGRWVTTAEYGRVWVPNAAPGWAPYDDGRWVWEDYYGWTWIGAEPWGWAPYHYGRWFYEGGLGWAWYPGAAAPWSPALVGFVLTDAEIAWVPLAPRERLYAWWGDHRVADYAHARALDFRNARYRNAIVAMRRDSFARGDFSHVRHVEARGLHGSAVARTMLHIAPSHQNFRLTSRTPSGIRAFDAHRTFAGHEVARREGFAVQRTTVTTSFGPHRPATTTTTSTTTFGPRARATTTTTTTTFGPKAGTSSTTGGAGFAARGGTSSTGKGADAMTFTPHSTGTSPTYRGSPSTTYGTSRTYGASRSYGTGTNGGGGAPYRAPSSTTYGTNRTYGGGTTNATPPRQYAPAPQRQYQQPVRLQRPAPTPPPRKK